QNSERAPCNWVTVLAFVVALALLLRCQQSLTGQNAGTRRRGFVTCDCLQHHDGIDHRHIDVCERLFARLLPLWPTWSTSGSLRHRLSFLFRNPGFWKLSPRACVLRMSPRAVATPRSAEI